MNVLTVNTGSSSVRLAAFAAGTKRWSPSDAHHAEPEGDPEAQLTSFARGCGAIEAVAHRVVHGGDALTRSCLIDADVEAEIERLAPLAPLHNPRALAWIRASRRALGGGVSQVAVFDTAFYAELPEVARRYALPRALCKAHGARRYGFHGIAHAAQWRRWCALSPERAATGRVVSLQLGAGCSITAIDRGRPIDTSMGFSPLEGLSWRPAAEMWIPA